MMPIHLDKIRKYNETDLKTRKSGNRRMLILNFLKEHKLYAYTVSEITEAVEKIRVKSYNESIESWNTRVFDNYQVSAYLSNLRRQKKSNVHIKGNYHWYDDGEKDE